MRLWEFFEAEDGRLSMTRLVVLLTWPPATYVLIKHPDQLVNYLGAYVASYAAGKASDIFMRSNNESVQMVSSSSVVSSDVSSNVESVDLETKSKSVRRKSRRAF